MLVGINEGGVLEVGGEEDGDGGVWVVIYRE